MRKWTSCRQIQKRLWPYLKIYQFGTQKFINLKKPTKKDAERANSALSFARKALAQKPNILLLDEINLAAAAGLIDRKHVIDMLLNVPKKTTVFMTGRFAPKEFLRRADSVTRIEMTKKPKRMEEKKGIEF